MPARFILEKAFTTYEMKVIEMGYYRGHKFKPQAP